MREKTLFAVIVSFLFVGVASGVLNTEIRYEITDLGAGRWEYTYTVLNKPESLIEHVEEFTIWFDYDLYDNLTITTGNPPSSGWNEIVIQPEPVLEDDGAYDAKTLGLGIGVSESVSGFSVSFDWLGTGEPGSQLYHIVDPDNYPVPIETGSTVPEPATLLLLGLGVLIMRREKNNNRNF